MQVNLKPVIRKVSCLILLVGLGLSGFGAGGTSSASAQAIESQSARAANTTTVDGLLQFTSGGHALGFTSQGMYAATGSHALHVDFVNANHVQPQADSGTNTKGMAAPLSRVTYTDLWDGISLTYTATAGGVYTTTYTIAPEADARNIRLRYNAPLTLNRDGTLTIAFETGALSESAPIAWQQINNQRLPVDISFEVHGQEVSFAVGAYDPRYELTVDPSLIWNTFLGGGDADVSHAIAVDGSGNVYVAGQSYITWGNPVRAHSDGWDAFAAKLDSSGSLTWNTFLGGSALFEFGYAIAVDGSGNVYVSGDSGATWGSPVRAYSGLYDAFAAKLDSSGELTWNTFLGGSGSDSGGAIAVDGGGNVYVAGYSYDAWGCSPTACTVRAFTSGVDAFAAKLGSSGGLTWNTFLGGSGSDYGEAIVIDGNWNVYVAGEGGGWGSPVRAYTAGDWDAFAAKLDSSGGLTWNTFLGGSAEDRDGGIAVDGSGNVYVTGYSLATWGSPVRAYTFGYDAFAAKLNSSGGLTWNTFLGGDGHDYGGSAIAVDGSGNVYVAGTSNVSWGSPVGAYTSLEDAFAAKLGSSGGLTWNTFLGGSGGDYGNAIAVDGSGNVYMAGTSLATWGCSPTPCTVRAFTGNEDAFAAKLGAIVSGNAGISGATLSYTDGTPKTATADGNGNYSFIVPYGWSGIVTPSLTGYAFTPSSRTYSNVLADMTGENYTATPITYTISGNAGVAGATLSYTDGTPQTATADGSGNYSFAVSYNWSGTVTPSKIGYTFSPTSRTYSNVIADQTAQDYTATIAATFADVPTNYWAWSWIERLYAAGITGGCGASPLIYCPEDNVTRAQMAIFLERGIHGSSFNPPVVTLTFTDTAGNFAQYWIEALKSDGITSGCGPSLYCPDASTTRAEMAIFLLRSKHGASYVPPAASGTLFTDVPSSYWAASWIEQLATEGITSGCGMNLYCPDATVTRAQMAVFLVRTFNLP